MTQTPIMNANGNQEWRNQEGDLHCEDGPAVIHADGSRSWYFEGLKHRDNGPAYEGADGYTQWWKHGSLHREDGPAVIFKDGSQQWWINGRTLSSTEYAAWQEKEQEALKRRQQQLLDIIDSLNDGTTEPVSTLPKIKILKPRK